MAGGMHGGGCVCGRGHAWQGGMHGRGHAWQGGMHGTHTPQQILYYWNAFLFFEINIFAVFIHLIHMDEKATQSYLPATIAIADLFWLQIRGVSISVLQQQNFVQHTLKLNSKQFFKRCFIQF